MGKQPMKNKKKGLGKKNELKKVISEEMEENILNMFTRKPVGELSRNPLERNKTVGIIYLYTILFESLNLECFKMPPFTYTVNGVYSAEIVDLIRKTLGDEELGAKYLVKREEDDYDVVISNIIKMKPVELDERTWVNFLSSVLFLNQSFTKTKVKNKILNQFVGLDEDKFDVWWRYLKDVGLLK